MMDIKEIQQYLGEDWEKVCSLIDESVSSEVSLLHETNSYLLKHQGKRLRPVLGLLMARACGEVTNDSICVATAGELLHNATLLHDDVVDCSSQRHGAPSVASMLGGRQSVLIGDFWLVKTMTTMLECRNHSEEVARAFAKTLLNLAEGEMFQLEKAEACDTIEEDYLRIIYSKTASLFEAICVAAAISVDAPQEMKDAAREYGEALGMAFQIKDDIMDYDGCKLGKPTGMDLKERKITMPLLGALESVDETRGKEVRNMIRAIPDHPEYCAVITAMVMENGGIEKATLKLDAYVAKAKKALDALPESKERDYLSALADFCAYRTN